MHHVHATPCAGTPARLVDGSTSPLEAVTVLVSPVGLVALVGLVVALEIVPGARAQETKCKEIWQEAIKQCHQSVIMRCDAMCMTPLPNLKALRCP